jgi:hypothetical protein
MRYRASARVLVILVLLPCSAIACKQKETGNAIADILFGQINPSGKLPVSFPKELKDTPVQQRKIQCKPYTLIHNQRAV